MDGGSVRVTRHGTALERGGRVVRWIDLAGRLGDPAPRGPRFAAAAVRGDSVDVELTDGTRESIPAAVFGPAPAVPELVIETAGTVLTCNGDEAEPLGVVRGGAVVVGGGKLLWVGRREALAACGLDVSGARRIDAGERLVTPGLIDCHAHPIFAGNRAGEFARRAAGDSYQAIAAAGGGIAATVAATRAASFDDLCELTCARVARAVAAGTTTMEAKSGYDLTVDGELRMLEVALAVDAIAPVDLWPTLLGAHVVPPERRGDRAGYLADVTDRMIPAAAARGLARAVDVYCDEGAFDLDETRRVLQAGRAAGLIVRAHAGQFADLGAPQLVAELGGSSADHLEVVSADGIRAMAAHGVVAVMLPAACIQLRQDPPPVPALREAGVALAVASDCNPGTSMGETLPVPMWLATTRYGMTVDEVWLGVTTRAARALGRHDIGVLAPGAAADVVVWNATDPAEIPYRYDAAQATCVIKAGRVAWTSGQP